jgi:hypothetical protein
MERRLVDPIVVDTIEAIADGSVVNGDAEGLLCSAELSKNLTQVRAIAVLDALLADAGETGQHTSDAKIRSLLGAVAAQMGESEIRWIVLATNMKRLDMVNVGLM